MFTLLERIFELDQNTAWLLRQLAKTQAERIQGVPELNYHGLAW